MNINRKVDFYDFIKSNKVIEVGVAFIVSNQITTVTSSFIENIISPIIKIFLSNDESLKLENLNLHLFGANIEYGRFLLNLLKFLLTMVIIYYLLIFREKLNLISL